MPPTDNYQVVLYVSIDPDQCPINVTDFMYGVADGVSNYPGLTWEVGSIDNADYAVGE
jgi:hypothetical protein